MPDEILPAHELAAMCAEVCRRFLILTPASVVEPLLPLSEAETTLSRLVRDAVTALDAIIGAATIPFLLTNDKVSQLRFNSYFAAERIRTLKTGPIADVGRAREIANDRMNAFARSMEGGEHLRNAVASDLFVSLKHQKTANAAAQLLSQALVETWSLFEVFSSSFVIHAVNTRPALAPQLLADPANRKFFGRDTIDISALAENDFDLSKTMGDVLFHERRLDKLPVIRNLFNVILPDADVRKALADPALWLLNQKRHLIVHKRGIVDREYLERTGENREIGSKLSPEAHDIEAYLHTVKDTILAIALAARSLTSSTA